MSHHSVDLSEPSFRLADTQCQWKGEFELSNENNQTPSRNGNGNGRRIATSRSEISHIALELFLEQGFESTTVDDIAAAAGIGRRTLFRYFSSKNDLPWGDFASELARMKEHLESIPSTVPLRDALRDAVVDFNQFPNEEANLHRERMQLLLNVPSLIAHSTLRYASWRQVIAEFVAQRIGKPEESLEVQAIAWVCLGASLSAYEQWLKDEHAQLSTLLERAFNELGQHFSSRS